MMRAPAALLSYTRREKTWYTDEEEKNKVLGIKKDHFKITV
jgi:hypothetical protein